MLDIIANNLPLVCFLIILVDILVLFFFHLQVLRVKKKSQIYEEENRRLSKYKPIEDAENKAQQIIKSANAAYEQANEKGLTIIQDAKAQAEKLRNSSNMESAQIIETAHKNAEEIAGDAFKTKANLEIYERAIKAIQNRIDGYGNEYLVPPQGLLDELADNIGHAEAGRELQNARSRVRSMIEHAVAATSSYSDPRRREKAVEFVLDYFNAKVDAILSKVKHDNYGKLAQEIQDAFSMVNLQGLAFRDARITKEFLNARLGELKWATVVHQLKLDEREEQRRIKEQIREEEKARREYERAIRETAKEEDMLRVAMEKARHSLEEAKEEQKAKYEAQLQELSQRLKDAEERNQRAISMAQQTKRGHVYIISNIGSFGENIYKIGLTRRLDPLDRVRELGDASVPFDFDVHAMIYSENAPELENKLHKHFVFMQLNKVNRRKEFFRVDLSHIRKEIESLGINVNWTMIAEAAHYHESVAMEKLMKENSTLRKAWLDKQLIEEKLILTSKNGESIEPDEDEAVLSIADN